VTQLVSSTDQRVRRIQQRMQDADLDILVCLKQQNSFYITNFNPILYSHPVVAIVPANGDAILLVHALRDDHARSAFDGDVRLFGAWGDKVTMGMSWTSALQEIVKNVGGLSGRIGMDLDFVPSGVLEELTALFHGAKIVDASHVMASARAVKDETEIARLRIACAQTDEAMKAAAAVLSERGSERDVTVAAMHAMQKVWAGATHDYEIADFGNTEGAVHSGLGAYCLVGDRIANMADNPTMRRPQEGDLSMVFIFGLCEGMHSEQERCFAIGNISDEARRAYDTFLEARELAFEVIKPGVAFSDIYYAASAAYATRGYDDLLPGRIGHSLGLGAHEEPSISKHENMLLEPGMVMTIEPSIRVPALSRSGGQHSDTIVVTDDGFEFLTTHDRGFLQV